MKAAVCAMEDVGWKANTDDSQIPNTACVEEH